MPSWIGELVQRIDRAYERRLQRASGLAESGASVHPDEPAGDDDVEIVNLPRGALVPAADDDSAEIVNLPRGVTREEEAVSANDRRQGDQAEELDDQRRPLE